ncbi:conserved Plasmodium protein, unknown function [Plasmodium berghei]|uniref:Homologous recombination OB-fold protein OB-fold domain-containing protein n=2 Tax=Plasmodium berghei TaxID=5821 RepID=A0A509AKQ8_PLABA|nr:conserved protein, unknown function [Plasmodium berghei ANKA]CXI62778.1 conserved Plasmodium protein, unknown function [Plasmodium berghei]SCM23743.1 conserved Plasmodium protein, unknown function [Plasmodium berghei]SCN26752.1 conserved Plasmodium protein, unknown function [Plasmodium berghei]SCO61075.1 conserved Plasmodium protein, unknown function [Plasmodium berghei]SCO63171.1 conserved Plasmodium protein, unknown function [Plasmodium berghei]|eukprot:XP_034422368.1 conserved protein, unknown function [Plasmodium berghei ANKA]
MLDENLSCLLDESDDDCIKKNNKKNELKNNKQTPHSSKGSVQKSNKQNPLSSILNFNIRNIGNLDSFFKNNNDENRNVSNNSSCINTTDHFNYQNSLRNNSFFYSNINGEDDDNTSTLGKGETNKTKNYEHVSKKCYKNNNLHEQKNAQLKNNKSSNNNSHKIAVNSEMHESVNNTNCTNKKQTVHGIGNHCKLSKNKNSELPNNAINTNYDINNKEEDKLYMNTTRNISRKIPRHETNLYKEHFLKKQINNDQIFQRKEAYNNDDDATLGTNICNWIDENNISNGDIMKITKNKKSNELVLHNNEIVKNTFSNYSYLSEKNNINNENDMNFDSLLSFETNKKSYSTSILNNIDSYDTLNLKKTDLQNIKNNINELTNNIPSYISKEQINKDAPFLIENNLIENEKLSSNIYNKKDYDRNKKLIYCYSFIKYNSWLKALKILNLPIDPFHLSINAHKYFRKNNNTNNNDSFLYIYNIHNILKNKHFSNYKINKMIVLIKNIKCHNHGYFIICMDPSGQMPASLHHEIEKEYKKYIDVGSTLILKDVTVFETIDNLPYLIITLRSLVRVIKAEDTHYSVKDEIYNKICSLIK